MSPDIERGTRENIASWDESESSVHPSYRRETIKSPVSRYPAPQPHPINIRRTASSDTRPGSGQSNRQTGRWYEDVHRWIRDQPSNKPPNQTGEEFITNLRHDIAPAHWLLYWLQGVLWVPCLVYFLARLCRLGNTLEFECYELKTQMLQSESNGSTKSPGDGFVPSSLTIPDTFRAPGGSSNTCVLTPLNPATLLAESFITLLMIGVICCGLAFVLQGVYLRLFGACLLKSGAYGTRTLVIRVTSQICCTFVSVGVVVGVAWAIAGH